MTKSNKYCIHTMVLGIGFFLSDDSTNLIQLVLCLLPSPIFEKDWGGYLRTNEQLNRAIRAYLQNLNWNFG